MQPTRALLSMLCVVFALAAALVKPLPGRAAGAGDARTSASPTRTTQFHLPFGKQVVRFARHLIGIRYVYGGSTPRSGFDCSGFVRYVYGHFGVSLPRTTWGQFDRGRRVSRRGLRPGDLVFFDGVGHVGMYVGNGRFIHAPHSGTRVRVEQMAGWYSSRFVGARRLRSA